MKYKKHPVYSHLDIYEDGGVYSHISKKFLKQSKNEFGYCFVCVTVEQNSYRKYRVHRLVAETYLDNPDRLREVNHIDGVKSNNHVSNLEWCSSKQNKKHGWENGLYTSKGSSHHLTNLSEEQVHDICRYLQDGRRNKEVADKFGVELDVVTSIKNGKNWKHISKDYRFTLRREHRKSEKEIRKICELIEQGLTNREIEEITGTDRKEVYRIKSRTVFKTISNDYNF